MKKVILIGALVASFSSGNLYAAVCSDTAPGDGYNDDCDAVMQLDIPVFSIIAFPVASGADGSDLSVVWDGSTVVGPVSDTINICIGTNSNLGVDVTSSSLNATAYNVTDGTTNVPYSLTLDGDDLTDNAHTIAAADATDLVCTVSDIPLVLEFDNAVLATTPTDGTTAFTDTVTLTVSPQ